MTDNKTLIHEKVFNIEWGDMDALGHVNNGRYFDYFQQARIDWLDSIKISMDQNQGPVLIHIACTFLKPVIYPATVHLKSYMHSLGRSSFIVDHELLQNEEVMAHATSKIVWVDYLKNKSVPVPEIIRGFF